MPHLNVFFSLGWLRLQSGLLVFIFVSLGPTLASTCNAQDVDEAFALLETGAFEEARSVLDSLSESGNPEVYLLLGLIHDLGLGVEQNGAQAAQWYGRAGDSGHPLGKLYLAILHHEGREVERDLQHASELLLEVVMHMPDLDGTHAEASYLLGEIHSEGLAGKPNFNTALTWYFRAAREEHPLAAHRLAQMFYEGAVIDRDPQVAAHFARQAASPFYLEPAIILFELLTGPDGGELGDGVIPAKAEALMWGTVLTDAGLVDSLVVDQLRATTNERDLALVDLMSEQLAMYMEMIQAIGDEVATYSGHGPPIFIAPPRLRAQPQPIEPATAARERAGLACGSQEGAARAVDRLGDAQPWSFDFEGLGLTSVPQEIGDHPQLKALSLSNNCLESLPIEILDLHDLHSLNLRGNDIRSIPPEILRLSNLETLILRDNRIEIVPDELLLLANLRRLDLSMNPLRRLPEPIGSLASLQSLSLFRVPLESLPSDIGELSSLVTFTLTESSISSIPTGLFDLGRLEYLSWGRNALTEVPPEIARLGSLRELALENNNLTALPDELSELSELFSLMISGNPFPVFPDVIFDMPHLKILQLDGSFSSVPPSISRLENIEELAIRNTNITTLPDEISQLRHLRHLFLENNPIPEREQERIRMLVPWADVRF